MLLIVSCHQQPKEINPEPNQPINNNLLKPSFAQPGDTTYALSVNGDTLILSLKIDSIGQHQNIPISVQSGKNIFAEVSSKDTLANIRFTQIQMPDLKFDGPFDRSLQYKIKDTGKYHLIIGENQMAGNPWKGEFILKAWVK